MIMKKAFITAMLGSSRIYHQTKFAYYFKAKFLKQNTGAMNLNNCNFPMRSRFTVLKVRNIKMRSFLWQIVMGGCFRKIYPP